MTVCSINVWIDLHNENVLLKNYIPSFSSWVNDTVPFVPLHVLPELIFSCVMFSKSSQ